MYFITICVALQFATLYGKSVAHDDVNYNELEDTVDKLIKELSIDSDDYTSTYNSDNINKGLHRLKQITNDIKDNSRSAKEELVKEELVKEEKKNTITFDEFKRNFLSSEAIQKIIWHGKRDVNDKDSEDKQTEEVMTSIRNLLRTDEGTQVNAERKSVKNTDSIFSADKKKNDDIERKKETVLSSVKDILRENEELRFKLNEKNAENDHNSFDEKLDTSTAEFHQSDSTKKTHNTLKYRLYDAIKAKLDSIGKKARINDAPKYTNDMRNDVPEYTKSDASDSFDLNLNNVEGKEFSTENNLDKKELKESLIKLLRYLDEKNSLDSRHKNIKDGTSSSDNLLNTLYNFEKQGHSFT